MGRLCFGPSSYGLDPRVDHERQVPEGREFLDLIWHREDECQSRTDSLLPNLGEKAPATLIHVGTVLSLLDRMASCWWGCRGGDHRIEYLCGRAVSNGRAALRLLRFSFYDESLALTRSIGEVANLMHLFTVQESALKQWLNATPKVARTEFRPGAVRARLGNLGRSPVVSQERYGLLSERTTHPSPQTVPQSHNILGVPHAGGFVQEEGVLVSLNELALPLRLVASFGAILLGVDDDTRKRIDNAVDTLAQHTGDVDLTKVGEYHSLLLSHPEIAKDAAKLASVVRAHQRSARHRVS